MTDPSDHQPVTVTDPDDPRVTDYTALNDPVVRRQVERAGEYFVVEGVLAIERLLALPRWRIRSLLLLPKVAERLAAQLAARDGGREGAGEGDGDGDGPVVFTAEEDVLNQVVGFDLHRGALASVDRQTSPAPSTDAVAADLLLVAEGVNDHENLGALYRNAAAFGLDAVVLDPTCADPFYRRAVRVSLGHVLALQTLRTEPFPTGLAHLHDLGVTTVALTPTGDQDLRDLHRGALGDGPVAVVVGAEGPGLTAAALATAHHRVAIEMADGVDSLNVATAAALALHHLRR